MSKRRIKYEDALRELNNNPSPLNTQHLVEIDEKKLSDMQKAMNAVEDIDESSKLRNNKCKKCSKQN